MTNLDLWLLYDSVQSWADFERIHAAARSLIDPPRRSVREMVSEAKRHADSAIDEHGHQDLG